MKKKITCMFGFVLSFYILTAQKANSRIGIMWEGKYVITSHLSKIKTEWSKLLKDQKIEGELIDFSITTGVDSGNHNKRYYILVGKNIINTVKVAAQLKLLKKTFYLPIPSKSGYSVVTCSGKNILSNPDIFHGNWICGKTCSPDSKKTVSVVE